MHKTVLTFDLYVGEPQVQSITSADDFTCITFFPDLKRFKMDCLDDDIISLLVRIYVIVIAIAIIRFKFALISAIIQ